MNRYATKHEILALCESKEWNAAYKTYILALNSNEKISPDTYELVSNACLQLGTWREANEVLTSCPKPSIRLMGNVIECCCHTAAGEVEMRIVLDVLERCVAEYVNMSQKLRGQKQNFDAMKRSLGSVLIAACRTRDDKKDREKKKKLHEFVPGGMERVVFGEPARTEAEAQVNVISTSLERLGVNDRHFLTYSATRDLFRGKSQNGNLSIPDIYANAIMNYVLYMAYMKESEFASNSARAGTHYQVFNASITGKAQIDNISNPNIDSRPQPVTAPAPVPG